MPTPIIDPTATTLGGAAFWIYVRQTLYNATISQEPLDLDFSIQLSPTADMIDDMHPLGWLRRETAWANQMLWTTACIANFCFSRPRREDDAASRASAWAELWARTQDWMSKRPKEFDPIGNGPPEKGAVFGYIWFTADWHGKCSISPIRSSEMISHKSACLRSLNKIVADQGHLWRWYSDKPRVLPLLLHPSHAV